MGRGGSPSDEIAAGDEPAPDGRWKAERAAEPAGESVADRYCRTLLSTADARDQLAALAQRAATDVNLHTAVRSPMLLRPMFLTHRERTDLERDLAALQELLLSLPARLYGGDVTAMCADLGFTATQTMLVEETWEDTAVLLSRADLMRDRHGFQVVEFNLHSSLGGIDSGPWHSAFLDVPVFAATATAEDLTFVDPVDGVAGVLRSVARDRGLGGFPTVAIVDWPTSYSKIAPRLERLAAMLRRRGFEAFHCHAGELSVHGDSLCARGRRIGLLYRIFLIEDVLSDPALVAPILAAHRAGKVTLAMSFVAELVGNKGCLAMLHDPANASAFTPAERDLVARLVPPTAWVTSRHADSPVVETGALAGCRREDLILKPAGGYAARGITAGWLSDPDAWRSALSAAAGKPWVCQRRVPPTPEFVPVLTESGVELRPVDVNWGVFLAGNRYNGAMIRATSEAGQQLITTSTGAAVTPCFVARA